MEYPLLSFMFCSDSVWMDISLKIKCFANINQYNIIMALLLFTIATD